MIINSKQKLKDFIKDIIYLTKIRKPKDYIHIYGKYPNLKYIYDKGIQNRNISTIKIIKEMFEKYKNNFINKDIDINIYTGDSADKAEHLRKLFKLKRIYAYSTMKEYENTVIPIPDFIFDCWKESGISSYDKIISECQNSGLKSYIDNRCFWIGSIKTHETRKKLVELSNSYPDLLLATSMRWLSSQKGSLQKASKFVTLPEHAEYKYLIDIQGYGYSGRLKILFWLRRPIFIVKRRHMEYFFKYLKDGENCIFVNEDLSNLILKIKFIEENPELYMNIVNNAEIFAKKYLTKDFALKYLSKRFLEDI
jgi:hypothetical protein